MASVFANKQGIPEACKNHLKIKDTGKSAETNWVISWLKLFWERHLELKSCVWEVCTGKNWMEEAPRVSL